MATLTWIHEQIDSLCGYSDPRLKGWPLIDSPLGPASLITAYGLFVYYGPKWMANRKPFQLTPVLVVYNFSMVFYNYFIVQELLLGGWLFDYSLGCQPVDYSNNPKALRIANAAWMFFIAKYIELLDTVFFILRKKQSQVTYLHVFHHGALPLLWWWGVRLVPGGFGSFHGLVNATVHVVMYFYYGLSVLGPKVQKYLWWKRYLTVLQLAQFFIVTVHNSQYLFIECSYPWYFVAAIQLLTTVIALLFLNFYIKTYRQQSVGKSNQKHVENESVSNGSSKRHVNGVSGNDYLSRNDIKYRSVK